ncbi:MAG TPA: hypothetical protein IAD03_02250 [Candidatus Caccousia stercoris]|uniref:Uncharacterized protein n=1 Tax=Candidatus Caccousia stercoris TaxID=2840723 RepID=A0A9D1FQU2_9FIRM|nr:hypothetical protein [Candidatus Caccousia stercoris]
MTGGKKDEFLFQVSILVTAFLLWAIRRRSAELGSSDFVFALVASGRGDTDCGVPYFVLASVLFGALSHVVPQYRETVGGKPEISQSLE